MCVLSLRWRHPHKSGNQGRCLGKWKQSGRHASRSAAHYNVWLNLLVFLTAESTGHSFQSKSGTHWWDLCAAAVFLFTLTQTLSLSQCVWSLIENKVDLNWRSHGRTCTPSLWRPRSTVSFCSLCPLPVRWPSFLSAKTNELCPFK